MTDDRLKFVALPSSGVLLAFPVKPGVVLQFRSVDHAECCEWLKNHGFFTGLFTGYARDGWDVTFRPVDDGTFRGWHCRAVRKDQTCAE